MRRLPGEQDSNSTATAKSVAALQQGRGEAYRKTPLLPGEGSPRLPRHGRARPDHPRLPLRRAEFKTWMLATRASMTPRHRGRPANLSPPPKPRLCFCPSRPNRGGFARHHEAGRESGLRGERALRARTSALRKGAIHLCGQPARSTAEGFSSMGEALPVLPDVTRRRRHHREPRAGLGRRPMALLRQKTSTFGTQPSTATPPGPAPSLGWRSPQILAASSRREHRPVASNPVSGAAAIAFHVACPDRADLTQPPRSSWASEARPGIHRRAQRSTMDPGAARLRRLSRMTGLRPRTSRPHPEEARMGRLEGCSSWFQRLREHPSRRPPKRPPQDQVESCRKLAGH
jgi:hypothetical protein